MELWIRSQDKERLIKISSVFMEYNGDVDPNMHTYKISDDKCVKLGIYKTKERALEVLDEIQKTIEPKILLDSKSIKQNNIYEQNGVIYANYNANATFEQSNIVVYEMPEE